MEIPRSIRYDTVADEAIKKYRAVGDGPSRIDDIMSGVEWRIGIAPESVPSINGSLLRAIRTESVDGIPELLVIYKHENEGPIDILFLFEVPVFPEEDIEDI